MQILAELGQWVFNRLNRVNTVEPPSTVPTPGQASYTVGRKRSPSFHTTSEGQVYVAEDKIIGKGQGGSVRSLKPVDPDSKAVDLVVKKNLTTQQKATNLNRAAAFIGTAYPELAPYVHVFDDNNDPRLVMPRMGEKTLGKMLAEPGRTLNSRYAYYIRALQELRRLRDKGIVHNDAHIENILFDKTDKCYFIDGERFVIKDEKFLKDLNKGLYYDEDLQKFKYQNINPFVLQVADLDWDSVRIDKQYYPHHIHLRINPKKKTIEYHVVNLQGKMTKNIITLKDFRSALNDEEYKNLQAYFADCDTEKLENTLLPVILEITSRRGETAPHHRTFFSENFLRDLYNSYNFQSIENVFIKEAQHNHGIVIELIKKIHTHLLQSIEAGLAVTSIDPTSKSLLIQLKSEIEAIDVNADFNFDPLSTHDKKDDVLRGLMHQLYQVERVCSHQKRHSPRMFYREESAIYQATEPFFDTIREELRYHLPHLPEIPVSRDNIVYANKPEKCDTFASYAKKNSGGN